MNSAENKAQRVLVLGAGGFLGQHLAEVLGGRALSVVRPSAQIAEGVLSHDLRDESGLRRLLEDSGASAVINCAALASPVHCEEHRDAATALNAELPRALGEWGAEVGARVIHVSTDLVFGVRGAPAGGFSEEDAPDPASFYGETKALGEAALLELEAGALIVRLPLLYGDPKGTGRGASEALFSTLARGERPSLFIDEWRCPLPVSVAAAALAELIDEQISGVLHVAGAERVSRFDLGLAIHHARFGEPARARRELKGCLREELELSPPRPEDASLCIRRAAALLGTKLPGLAEGVRLAAYPA